MSPLFCHVRYSPHHSLKHLHGTDEPIQINKTSPVNYQTIQFVH